MFLIDHSRHRIHFRTPSTTRSMPSSVCSCNALARPRTARRNPLSFCRFRYSRSASRTTSLFVRCSFFASFSACFRSPGGMEMVTILLCRINDPFGCVLHCNVATQRMVVKSVRNYAPTQRPDNLILTDLLLAYFGLTNSKLKT